MKVVGMGQGTDQHTMGLLTPVLIMRILAQLKHANTHLELYSSVEPPSSQCSRHKMVFVGYLLSANWRKY